jgi:hypothetical protein
MMSSEAIRMRTNSNLTIYNRYIVSGAEKYQRTQIGALGSFSVAWENRKASNILRTGGTISADQATIFIPFTCGINYLQPKAWQALSTKTGKWTIQEGDIVVKGLVSDEIHDLIPAVTGPPLVPAVPAFTVTILRAKYDDVLIVTSVDAMLAGSLNMRHWKVGAK